MSYDTILYREDGPIGWLTLNRPDDGNMFTATMCHEIRDCINAVRRETRTREPVITSINGFAVGGGNVLQVVCDLSIAKESAVFRQVGPMMGSFDAGFGTWYLEDLVGKRKAKELWYLNPKIPAREALEMGLINRVVADSKLRATTR